jgi:energy-coupling factor transport system substrate-specific component
VSRARDICIVGVCTALLVAGQFALAGLANIEIVSLLIILYTRYLKHRTLFIIYLFALIQGLMYGFHIWWFCYLYVWTLLYFLARAVGDVEQPLVWAIVSGIFGILFGTLCSVPHFITMGFAGGVAWIMSGVLFDLVHCFGNFVLALLLYKPLSRMMQRAVGRYLAEA